MPLCNGARILGIVQSPSYSHQVTFRPLWRALLERGHHLTLITTDPMNDVTLKNLTEIDLHSAYEIKNRNMNHVAGASKSKSAVAAFVSLFNLINQLNENQLNHPEVRALIDSETEHFDLLIVEYAIPTMFAFSEKFKCPYIGILSFDMPSVLYGILGNPSHPVLYPDSNLPFGDELSFLERIMSALFDVLTYIFFVFNFFLQNRVVETHFGKDYPPLIDIARNVSMIFISTDPIFHRIRPLDSTILQIGGGMRRKSDQPLPKNLQEFLDNAAEGFIYFSLGSNVNGAFFSEEFLHIVLETFAELPYKILWKFEPEKLPKKSSDVLVAKWLPQLAVLEHPKIKLFITQGGLQSMEEAIYNHVPMIGMPFFGDQFSNVKRIASKGLGLSLDPNNFDKQTFKSTILEVINNPKYRNRIKELVKLADDQPMTGLERAVWWTEYVIRNKRTKHLRSRAADLPLYQYLLLDVFVVCFSILTLFVYLICATFKICRKFAFPVKEKVL